MTARQYAIENYKAYNLGLNSPDEMEKLLNILDAYNETLDSLHAAGNNFLGFYFSGPVTDADIVKAIFENADFLNDTEYENFIANWKTEAAADGLTLQDVMTDWDIFHINGGHVVRVYC